MKTTIFQISLFILLGFIFITAVLIFAGVLPGFKTKPVGSEATVVLWGTVNSLKMVNLIEEINHNSSSKFKINYIQKDLTTINEDLLEALASGAGPDLVLLPHELIFQNRNKLIPLPFSGFSERQFQDYFIDSGKIFKTTKGWLALPVAIDPFVLYFNKELYTNANLLTPPSSWEEMVAIQPKLTLLDNAKLIRQSAVSFGTSNNVSHFKEIISLLVMQVGIIPINIDAKDDYFVGLGVSGNNGLLKTNMALDFYNQFSDQNLSTYTWNRSLPKDTDFFLSGNLANYFGLASELGSLKERNPHLNFDVASVPRLNKGENLTVGRVYGIAAVKNSSKISAAFLASLELALVDHESSELADSLNLAPVLRSSLSNLPADPMLQVFYREAQVCRVWADPSEVKTTIVFKELIDNVSSGKLSTDRALSEAVKALRLIIVNSK